MTDYQCGRACVHCGAVAYSSSASPSTLLCLILRTVTIWITLIADGPADLSDTTLMHMQIRGGSGQPRPHIGTMTVEAAVAGAAGEEVASLTHHRPQKQPKISSNTVGWSGRRSQQLHRSLGRLCSFGGGGGPSATQHTLFRTIPSPSYRRNTETRYPQRQAACLPVAAVVCGLGSAR